MRPEQATVEIAKELHKLNQNLSEIISFMQTPVLRVENPELVASLKSLSQVQKGTIIPWPDDLRFDTPFYVPGYPMAQHQSKDSRGEEL